jgi:CobQ-like glutamine amidotransferase family enzyme
MITIYSFEPFYFNNNGDQGNIEVITQQLGKQDLKFKLTKDPGTADFILIGDCSLAVLQEFSKPLGRLRKIVAKRWAKGLPTLLVGSAYEFFAAELGLNPLTVRRESKFVTTGEGYFGYRNSDKNLPVCMVKGSFVATSLFGPVLAKNPQLLENILQSLGAELKLSAQATEWLRTIRSKSG